MGHIVHTITVPNVNYALGEGLWWLATAGSANDSRNGPVLVAPGPVITTYLHPTQRVLFSAARDANPFFHLYECIWMMAGRNDSATVARYAATMDQFADNGVLDGAYGYRWRLQWGFDQLDVIIDELRSNPKSRRAVLQMWDPMKDLLTTSVSKDVPCNTAVYFDASNGQLNMTVTNRSNDIVWGAYGANAVHMSFLQEFIAAAVGIPVGVYHQFSNNFHTYLGRPDVDRLIEQRAHTVGYNVLYSVDDRYGVVKPYALGHGQFNPQAFLDACEALALQPANELLAVSNPFLRHVFVPMMQAHALYKEGAPFADVYDALARCQAKDWRVAGIEWMQRREAARKLKEASANA